VRCAGGSDGIAIAACPFLHHRRGKLREAVKLHERVVKKAPQRVDALHLLGLVSVQRGRTGEASR
jgi:Flp pilus assembly protein TadD